MTGRRHRIVVASLAALLASLGACRDDSVAPRAPAPPVDQMTNLGSYMVEVNVKTGRVISYPTGSVTVPRGVDASVFGAPGSIAHIFQLQGGGPTAGNTFILRDHLENVFSFPIGTNVAHATGVFPQDTIGMYVYLTIGPTGIAGCTPNPVTCLVKADSGYDGAYPFTSVTPQPYMYFKTILEASDGALSQGLDFTDQSPANGGTGVDYFRALPFRTVGPVTNFRFGVSVSGARVAPNDSRWIVRYVTDSLPNRLGTSLTDLRTEPDWRVRGSAGAVTDTSIATTGCGTGVLRCLQIVSATPVLIVSPADTLTYFRSDSLGTSQKAYLMATVIPSNLVAGAPSVFMGMQDRVKLISFGLSANAVGLTDASNAFLSGGTTTINPTTTTTWRVAKFGTDSVVIYDGGGVKQHLYIYASLPAAPTASFPTSFFFFGNKALFSLTANPTAVTSRWSSVVYEIGATGP